MQLQLLLSHLGTLYKASRVINLHTNKLVKHLFLIVATKRIPMNKQDLRNTSAFLNMVVLASGWQGAPGHPASMLSFWPITTCASSTDTPNGCLGLVFKAQAGTWLVISAHSYFSYWCILYCDFYCDLASSRTRAPLACLRSPIFSIDCSSSLSCFMQSPLSLVKWCRNSRYLTK